jgi:hypothetical protein
MKFTTGATMKQTLAREVVGGSKDVWRVEAANRAARLEAMLRGGSDLYGRQLILDQARAVRRAVLRAM